jgi:hypothetical protein
VKDLRRSVSFDLRIGLVCPPNQGLQANEATRCLETATAAPAKQPLAGGGPNLPPANLPWT